ANPLVVTVASSFSEPVAGGKVTFAAPGSGASATLGTNPATIAADGKASVTATANGTIGTYAVTAAARGASPASVSFNLQNIALVVDTLADSTDPSDGKTSLREAIALANGAPGPNTIIFAAGLTGTITLTQGELIITDSVTITGPGASALTVSGN